MYSPRTTVALPTQRHVHKSEAQGGLLMIRGVVERFCAVRAWSNEPTCWAHKKKYVYIHIYIYAGGWLWAILSIVSSYERVTLSQSIVNWRGSFSDKQDGSMINTVQHNKTRVGVSWRANETSSLHTLIASCRLKRFTSRITLHFIGC